MSKSDVGLDNYSHGSTTTKAMTAEAADAKSMVTDRTTGGRIITKDLQAAAATATTTQGAGLGHLLGEVLGIPIGIAIEIKIEMEAVAGSKIAIRIVPDKQ